VCDVKVNNRPPRENALTRDSIPRLVMLPGDETVEIAFTSLDYVSPGKTRYAYRLEGVDADWVEAASDRQFAVYNQLRPGRYTFRVKATDRNGLWDERPARVEIVKLPDFYETRWAYLLYLCLAAGCAYGAYRVLSNRIHLREELRVAQIEKEKSEELVQTKLRYFTNISHDLMTPLTIMLCLMDYEEKSVLRTDILRSNINRLRRLLQQILDFRKVESGNMRLKVARDDIVPFVRQICDRDFLPLVKRNNIAFSFEAGVDHLPAWFDADKVDKIIFNLLSNAFKYTPANGSISVRLRAGEREGHAWLSLEISDTGVGIPARDLPKIFVRFFNNNALTGESNGIGLSLTRDLVELHHGRVSVESEPGKGSTFTVEIPVDRESYRAEELSNTEVILAGDPEPAVAREEAAPRARSRVNILFVEDNEELLGIIKRRFAADFHVHAATDGAGALRVMRETEIDVVVSDVMMPGMDGLELCREIKNDPCTSHVAVLLLTAKNSTNDQVECYEAGADGYISKPFEMKVLEARIHNLVTKREKRQQEFKSDVDLNVSMLEYRSLDEKFLDNVIQSIEHNLPQSDFDIETLASDARMSKSSLYRKIKSMTGLSPHDFIRNVKLKHACRLLKEKPVSISEVAYAVGFSSPKYFAACFKSEFGVTPTEYQRAAGTAGIP
jgi:signal transduction histidine kinase/DNA-binding response OmpR family regulator